MTLDQAPPGARVFIDSNILVYHFQPHPTFGPTCQRLIERVERQDIEGPSHRPACLAKWLIASW